MNVREDKSIYINIKIVMPETRDERTRRLYKAGEITAEEAYLELL